MALVNALLVRYAKGYRWVLDEDSIDDHGRREAYLTLGAAQSPDEVDRVGTAVLATRKDPAQTTSAALEPTGVGDVPYEDWDLGDSISVPDETGTPASLRVRSLTVGEDAEGNATYVAELGTLIKEQAEATAVWLRRMANGALGGTAESAQPSFPPAPQVHQRPRSKELPPFSHPGALTTTPSPRYYVPQDIRVIEISGSLVTAGSTSTVVTLYRSGSSVATLTIPSSSNRAAVNVSVVYTGPAGQYVTVAATTLGAGAAGLVVALRIA